MQMIVKRWLFAVWLASAALLAGGLGLLTPINANAVDCPIKCCKNFIGTTCMKCNEQCLAENPKGTRLEQLQPKSRKPASAAKKGAVATAKNPKVASAAKPKTTAAAKPKVAAAAKPAAPAAKKKK